MTSEVNFWKKQKILLELVGSEEIKERTKRTEATILALIAFSHETYPILGENNLKIHRWEEEYV